MDKDKLYSFAFALAIATLILAFLEAVVSTYFGYEDESLTLFGFGLGSWIEVVSALGVATMIVRIRQNEESKRGQFENCYENNRILFLYFSSIINSDSILQHLHRSPPDNFNFRNYNFYCLNFIYVFTFLLQTKSR